MVAGATQFSELIEFIRSRWITMMKAQHNDLQFVIEEDHPDVGVYLYVYQDERCIHDFLQNDKATCIEIAFEDYGVPKELWSKISDGDDQLPRGGNDQYRSARG